MSCWRRTEGIFTEPAGGTTLAATQVLIKRGVIKSNESVVICITGNGYKTAEVMRDRVNKPVTIGRSLAEFERVVAPDGRQDGDGVAVYPTFLRLAGRKVVVVGGGPVAAGKLEACWRPARRSRSWLRTSGLNSSARACGWSEGLRAAGPGRRVVGGGGGSRRGEPAVLAAADARHLLVNAVDDPPNATAYLGGVVRRSDVTVAISTGGRAPALAGLLREAIDAWLPARPGRVDGGGGRGAARVETRRCADGAAAADAARDVEPVV